MAEAGQTSSSSSGLKGIHGVGKEPWESRYHWLCRRKFIEDHKNLYSPERVVCLSMAWANINFLATSYSGAVDNLVSYYPVPEKSELDRWLSVHREIEEEEREANKCARDEEMKITSKRTLSSSDQATSASKRPAMDSIDTGSDLSYSDLSQHLSAIITKMRNEQDSEQSVQTPPSPSQQPLLVDSTIKSNPHWKKVIKLLSCWCLCPRCFAEGQTHICCLNALCTKSKLNLEFEFQEEGDQVVKIIVDGVLMSSMPASSNNFKSAKGLAAQALMNEIQQHKERIQFECPATGRRVVGLSDISKSQAKDERIPEGNMGHQMLVKMGWSGDQGLGAHGQGKQDPVTFAFRNQRDREGLGGGTQSNLSQDGIKSMLRDFLMSDEQELEFSPDLTLEDRKSIHLLAQQFSLIHKSRGTGSARFLVLVKKTGFNYRNRDWDSGPGPIRHRNEARPAGKPYMRRQY